MAAFEFESMAGLLRRLKLGREEALQRSLTSLILRGPYPSWNRRSTPSTEGTAFLRTLYEHSFGTAWPDGHLAFVDEFELPARTEDEKGGAPDWAVLWSDRVWLIELKSEVASHRSAQIPQYFELGHHHHPGCSIDITYLTPRMPGSFTIAEPWARYAHVSWDEIVPMVRSAWQDQTVPGSARLVEDVCDAVGQLHLKPSQWRAALTQVEEDDVAVIHPLDRALALARETGSDGKQRALDVAFNSLEDLLELRLAVRDTIGDEPTGTPVRFVRPWLWRAETSTGQALTDAGRRTGYELRVSKYRTEQPSRRP